MSCAGQQVLPGPGRGGCGEHHESHQYQELLGRHQSHHPADAVPQQGTVLCADDETVLNVNKYLNKLSITYTCGISGDHQALSKVMGFLLNK